MKSVQAIICKLVEEYKYAPLSDIESKIARNFFKKNIPSNFDINGSNDLLFSHNNTAISYGYNRIVVGDYGAFIEISPEKICCELIIKPGQEFRLYESFKGKYVWYTLNDGSKIKIYYQIRTVKYADYKKDMYYISPYELKI